jgi:signal transduction histidine kinase
MWDPTDSLTAEVLRSLNVALFEETHRGLLLLQDGPEWMQRVWTDRGDGTWDFGGPFSFLDNFIEDARAFWPGAKHGESLTSEPWTENDRDGTELGLKAIALKFPHRSILAVEPLGSSFQFSQRALQQAHERGLENYRLESQATRLRAITEETARLNQMKRDFLAQMSHELRTPLNSIIGFSTLLSQGKGGELNSKQQGYVANVLTAAGHLQELIDDVMDLSRIESGQFPLHLSVVEAAQIGSEVAVLLGPRAAAKDIDLRIAVQSGVGVQADPLRLRQILGNLVGNAIKFTPTGGSVTLAMEIEPLAVRFVVTDTGAGIADSELPFIFDKFQQFPRTGVSANRGAGLGLAIAKGLVDLHGGWISVQSKVGEGSVFTVSIPQPQNG